MTIAPQSITRDQFKPVGSSSKAASSAKTNADRQRPKMSVRIKTCPGRISFQVVAIMLPPPGDATGGCLLLLVYTPSLRYNKASRPDAQTSGGSNTLNLFRRFSMRRLFTPGKSRIQHSCLN